MSKQISIIALVAVIVGFAGGYLFRGVQSPLSANSMYRMMGGYGGRGMTGSMMYGGAYGDARNYDQQFLAEMIMHHQGAILMSQVALEKATHPELKQFAQQIISAQSAEIEQMQEWQAAWSRSTSN